MLEKVVKQKMPYIVDSIHSIQEFLLSDLLNVDILYMHRPTSVSECTAKCLVLLDRQTFLALTCCVHASFVFPL